jgi:hypothetical protein
MDVPAGARLVLGWCSVGARLVLVSLAASLVDPELRKAAHYLDDVQVRIITHDFIP